MFEINQKWFLFWARFNAVFLGFEVAHMLNEFAAWRIIFMAIFTAGMVINWRRYTELQESEKENG